MRRLAPRDLLRSLLLLLLLLGAASSATVNLTVFRITPRNYTGLTNFDSGSSAGDAFFGLYELSAPLVCAGAGSKSGGGSLLCQNEPILQIPGFNVYTRTTVEADARLGDYSECNPDPDTGRFACQHFHFHHRSCWFNDTESPQWRTQFSDVCDPKICSCDAVEKQSVGHEILGNVFGQFSVKDWPQQCLDDFYAITGRVFAGKPDRTLDDVDEGECCSACSATKRSVLSGCGGYTYHEMNRTCEMFGVFSRPIHPAPDAHTRSGMNLKGTPYWSPLGSSTSQLAVLLNGSWYSTREEGECAEGQVPGKDDCWWRTVEQTSNVNSSCVNGNLLKTVQKARPECWDACGPDAKNMSSECFIKCVFETIVGNKTSKVPPMKKETLVNAFESSFVSDDPEYGCPQVPPCPAPCRPPVMVGEGGGEIAAPSQAWAAAEEDQESLMRAPVDVWFEEEVVKKGLFWP